MKSPIGNLLGLPLFPARSDTLALTVELSWKVGFLIGFIKNGILRRFEWFPSWTWLGWDLCSDKIKLDFIRFEEIKTSQAFITDINVELKNGITIPWEDNSRDILKRSTNGDSAECLCSRGWIGRVGNVASDPLELSQEARSAESPLITLVLEIWIADRLI